MEKYIQTSENQDLNDFLLETLAYAAVSQRLKVSNYCRVLTEYAKQKQKTGDLEKREVWNVWSLIVPSTQRK